ncbi:hypothetical protein RJ639_033064 [Escallonia herrerae]|uniref:Uncharacterized protein n=1 Tax=Escallonia herrerae TaxID=1293975 RepID=A0AA88X007_9ASTE|nr:hypothetical protein RJ639_033064 [Escallonia herrerae]
MGLVGCLVWVNSCTKKQCRSLLCRMRAVVKAAARNGGKRQFRFQYDPSSYALNFDDSVRHAATAKQELAHIKLLH